MLNAEQLLYESEKRNHQRFSIRPLFLKSLQYSWENTCVKILRTPILKNSCLQLLLNWLFEVIVWKFVSGLHLKRSWLSNITKYQSLSSQSFKQILVHMLSIYLTPALSCEPRFHMFIINDYCTESKYF